MSLPFLELPPLCSTPARPISHSSMINSSTINRTATGQPSLLPLQPLLNSNDANSGRYTLAPLVSNHASANTGSSHHYGKVPVTPGGQMITLPFTPSPTCNIARNANSTFTRTTSCFSIGSNTSNNSTMATPPSDDSADDLPVSPEQSIRLAGLKPPARYPGALPESFSRQDPVPGDESDNEDDESKKQKGAPSQNPWDYMRPLKKKERRRFTRRELEAIETLWWVEKAPNKYQRQRIGAWLGVKTKHITVWFQNKRQESKKHAKEQQETLDKSVKQDLEDTKTETHRADKENIAPTPSRSVKDNVPTPSSRTGRGSYDPGTGKWRPVPAYLISSAQPPAQAKCNAILAIANGELSREEFLTTTSAPTLALPRLARTRPVLGRSTSGSLEQILTERESTRPRGPRRSNLEEMVIEDGKECMRRMLLLMSSSPSSSDVAEDDESLSPQTGTSRRSSGGGSPIPKRRCIAPISVRPRDSFDRSQTDEVRNGPPTSSPPSLSPPTPQYLLRPPATFASMMSFDQNGRNGQSSFGSSNRHPTVDQGSRVFSADQSGTGHQRISRSDSETSLPQTAAPAYEDTDADVLEAAHSLFAMAECSVTVGSSSNTQQRLRR